MARRQRSKRFVREKSFSKRRRTSYKQKSASFDNITKGKNLVTADDIIGFIHSQGGSTVKEITHAFDIPRSARKDLHNLLTGLCREKRLALEDETYLVGKNEKLVEAIITVNPKGFAFGAVCPPHKEDYAQDLFISPRNLSTAIHGDKALLRILKKGRGRTEALVVRVLERSKTTMTGIYMAGRTTGLVIPDDDRYAFNIAVQKKKSLGARDGEAVVVEITEFRPDRKNALGKIIEVLGDPNDLKVQVEMVIRKHDLPHVFSNDVLSQTEALDAEIKPDPDRMDLRDILHVTIDGESARDFDDAVAIVKTEKGFRLYVSIADVSHYVQPKTPLDTEAYQRGTSVYFPNKVVPMLPERLSNNLCSLVPNEDRYAFSAIMDFDREGARINKTFSKSIIKSKHRLTYTIVKKMLVDKDKEVCRHFKDILTPINQMGELALLLEKKRMARGSIGFEIPEAEVVFDDTGMVSAIRRMERNRAHKLIEEFMLAANEAVAETLAKAERLDKTAPEPLFRVHESPDPVKVTEFVNFASTMGLYLGEASGSPAWFGKVLGMVAGKPQEYIVNNLLLRTMKQAHYSPENVGHFGLAAQYYTHFTSPIRRYPDLIVHRMLSDYLQLQKRKERKHEGYKIDSYDAGAFLSKLERRAVDAERDMTDRIKVRFMAGKEGETFEGIISGATSFGIFVELLDIFVSGAVEMADLRDDYYHYDEKSHRLVGRRANSTLQIGDLVLLRLVRVDLQKQQINFVLEEKHEQKAAQEV